MHLNRTFAIVLRYFYLVSGSPARILPMFAWVAVDIVLWGFITRYLTDFTRTGFSLVASLLGAVLLWDFLVRVMHGLTTVFLEDVWSRNFLNLFATPLTMAEYLGGLVISSVATSAFSLVFMVVLAGAVFGLSLFAYGAMLIPFLLVLFLFGIALGIAACGLVLRLGPAAEWFIWPIPAFLSPFAGVFYPIATLPKWMQAVAYILPPAYVFEGMRGVVAGRAVSAASLLWGAGLAAFYVLAAYRFFAGVHRYAVRTGLIARYSAESAS